MVVDFILLQAVMFAGLLIRFGTELPSEMSLFLVSFGVAALVVIVTFYFGGFYDETSRVGQVPNFPRALALSLVSGGFIALLSLLSSGLAREAPQFGFQSLPFPFLNLVVTVLLFPVLATTSRQAVSRLVQRRHGRPRVLVCGSRADLETFSQNAETQDGRYEIVGPVMNRKRLARAIDDLKPEAVAVVTPDWLSNDFDGLFESLFRKRVAVFSRITNREAMYGLHAMRNIFELPFALLRPSVLPRSRSQLKRLLDLAILAFFAPLWLSALGVISLIQLVAIGRPIFYVQNRVGLDERDFPMLKFRTMVVDAEHVTGPVLSHEGDSRVVRGARWLRAMRLDELPQLLNVIRGEMSLVGPRPERPEIIENYAVDIPGYRRRHSIRPGLTGLAQTYGRYSTNAEYKLGFDLLYASNWSPILDAGILLRTIWVVLARRV